MHINFNSHPRFDETDFEVVITPEHLTPYEKDGYGENCTMRAFAVNHAELVELFKTHACTADHEHFYDDEKPLLLYIPDGNVMEECIFFEFPRLTVWTEEEEADNGYIIPAVPPSEVEALCRFAFPNITSDFIENVVWYNWTDMQ